MQIIVETDDRQRKVKWLGSLPERYKQNILQDLERQGLSQTGDYKVVLGINKKQTRPNGLL
jgi:hypothetical protein